MAVPANAVPVSTWDALAQCESGGNWGISTGNGFSGGLQFTPSTWAAFGGSGNPQNASKGEQIRVAENVLAGQGWGAWPACSSSLGLSGGGGGYTPPAPAAPVAAPVEAAPMAQPAPAQVEAPAPAAKASAVETPVAPVVEAPAAPAAPVVAPAAATPVAVEYTAPAAAVAPVAPASAVYTVLAGDTLSSIAATHGVAGGWHSLYTANAATVANPNLIFPGQVLNIPA